ncbi:MAG: ABC transporter ATP-binding protein [Candidatus Marinimicrobia bacterium]|jgi:ABC-type multidrug transport system ATPase subunit|nr:ABC transporter ATP-binding protein [Candidatus Neomarinimicrobiota bacterium]MBT3839679.1 ABC transporter ATP-binding protein [Candidatus Neomarinimicrobiota bacterium]MBT4282413.1 ABC transporter ATP-binding protein [Candidatus Neomarinimicrobiota bacterium]MBT4580073.1 ABC transporter ATP-binding protein [Candidatus Neomarinimicrobiota bacterium]MBT4958324.1 ABC transporter ATP-binding protein [Candidatus Neomarinimicrobiota bacterium]
MRLSIKNISKTYPNGVEALKNVSLEIGNGMFGLLGPNGAGKSTLMRTIAALQDSDEGTITVGEIDVAKDKQSLREILGYLPQEFGVYPKVSALDLLDHMAVMKGIIDAKQRKAVLESLLQQTNLWTERHQKLGTFSGGMKQRFGIAQALLGDPKLIIVDEPTAGLDPMERNRFHNLLSEIGENVIVILSTHIVDDVSDLCNDMAIILNGEVKLEGEPILLIERMKGKVWKGLVEKSELKSIENEHQVISSRLYLGKVQVRLFSDSALSNGFKKTEPEIEDLYFATINGLNINGEF